MKPTKGTAEADKGDSASLILRGTVSELEEIRSEPLSWGAAVQVLAPAKLREQMRSQTRAMAAH